MKALVTGATGFIGRSVVERLRVDGHQVRALARNPAKLKVLEACDVEPAIGDVTDLESLRRATDGIDCVFHLAAFVTDWGNWRDFEAVTVAGTQNLLKAAIEAQVPRVAYVSTVAVYDDRFSRRNSVIPEDAPRGTEGDRLHGFYARAKVRAEEAVWEAHRSGAIAVTVLRPALVYGPGDRTTFPRLIEFLDSPTAVWVGSKNPTVDPIYVTDVADCIVRAATQSVGISEAYNVAPAERIGVRQFWTAVCQSVEIKPPRFTVPHSVVAAAAVACEAGGRLLKMKNPPMLTKAGVAIFAQDRHHTSTKAQTQLGWRPQVSLEEGLRRTAEWFRADKAAAKS